MAARDSALKEEMAARDKAVDSKLEALGEQMAARDKAVDSKLEALGERMVELLEMIRASSRSRGDG